MSANSCPLCRTWNATGATCVQVRCLACDAAQCHSYGLGHGACHYCFVGMLPGWSGNNNPMLANGQTAYPPACERTSVLCQYKGCAEMAVYGSLSGAKKRACKTHGLQVLARQTAAQAKRDAQYARYAR